MRTFRVYDVPGVHTVDIQAHYYVLDQGALHFRVPTGNVDMLGTPEFKTRITFALGCWSRVEEAGET